MAKTPFTSNAVPGGPFLITDSRFTTGSVFYVHSGTGASTNSGTTPDDPKATLNQAVALCTASKGDTILVMPGHAETIDSAADVDLNVVGIRVIGLGHGSSRPTFTFSTTADGTFAIGANSVHVENLLFVANFTNGVTVGVDIDDAHTDVYFKNCEWRAGASTKEFLKGVTIAEGAGRITFDGCRFTEVTGGDATAAIFTESTAGLITVTGCTFQGDWSVAVLDLDDDALVPGPQIWNNLAYNADVAAGLLCTVTAATVGFFVGNRSGLGKANTVPVTDGSASVFVDNLATDAAAISELKYPAVATAWS